MCSVLFWSADLFYASQGRTEQAQTTNRGSELRSAPLPQWKNNIMCCVVATVKHSKPSVWPDSDNESQLADPS